MSIVENFDLFAPRLINKKELLSSGHRACSGCGEVLAVRLMCKALGENTVIAAATGCMEIISSMFPTTAWRVPWIHVAFENTAAVASGVEAGLKALRRKGKIDDRYVKVVGMAGDGGTMDIGMQALSGAMERGHDMIFVCFDNEAYMNTGIQRSSGTPMGASTTTAPAGKVSSGQKTWKRTWLKLWLPTAYPMWRPFVPAIRWISSVRWKRRKVSRDLPISIVSPCVRRVGVPLPIRPYPWAVLLWRREYFLYLKWKTVIIGFLRICPESSDLSGIISNRRGVSAI